MPRKRSTKIRVSVVDFGREHLVLRWRDPVTRKFKHETSGTASRKEAEKLAAKKETKLELDHGPQGEITWQRFRCRYEEEYLETLAESTRKKACTALSYVESVLNPYRLADVTTDSLSSMFQRMRKTKPRSESTIAGYARQIKAAIGWAVEMGLITKSPQMPRMHRYRTESAKGRAITQPEFVAILNAVSDVVGEKRSASWLHYLKGLWWSGLRLEESLGLHWTDPKVMRVDLSGNHPMLLIRAEGEKGYSDRSYPVSPEFAKFLTDTPQNERSGFVFNPQPYSKRGERISPITVGRTITAFGEAAEIKSRDDSGKTKFASAHDFRRAFGFRWSERVMPAVLKELMRHASIDTTMTYYVTANAQATAEVLWSVVPSPNIEFGNISGNTISDTVTSESASSGSVGG